MRRILWLSAAMVVGVGVILPAGCGPAYPKGTLAFSGSVTLEGQPLDQGSIEFTSLPGQTEARSGAMVRNGSFSIPAHQGLPAGKYRVRVYSSAGDAAAAMPEAPGDSTEVEVTERIPAAWNTESEQEITVESGAKNEFRFDIQ